MNDDSQISNLLQKSLPQAKISNRFHAEVWQRIQARSALSTNRWWKRWFHFASELFMRPAFAALALLVVIGASAGAATLQAAESNERGRAELAHRHIAMLDAYIRLAAK